LFSAALELVDAASQFSEFVLMEGIVIFFEFSVGDNFPACLAGILLVFKSFVHLVFDLAKPTLQPQDFDVEITDLVLVLLLGLLPVVGLLVEGVSELRGGLVGCGEFPCNALDFALVGVHEGGDVVLVEDGHFGLEQLGLL
jgi:hypothetical protein